MSAAGDLFVVGRHVADALFDKARKRNSHRALLSFSAGKDTWPPPSRCASTTSRWCRSICTSPRPLVRRGEPGRLRAHLFHWAVVRLPHPSFLSYQDPPRSRLRARRADIPLLQMTDLEGMVRH